MNEESKVIKIYLPAFIWQEIREIGRIELIKAKRSGLYSEERKELDYYEKNSEENKYVIEEITFGVGIKKLISDGLKYYYLKEFFKL
ncbi:MAG: hypothetical protein J7K26_00240 [Candidatus Aenigmarchaeota archaeon]|nr:hypothetical protein [Candidatus Aenigmarchaeota archaeon]